jgi:hypothetical protein
MIESNVKDFQKHMRQHLGDNIAERISALDYDYHHPKIMEDQDQIIHESQKEIEQVCFIDHRQHLGKDLVKSN